MVWAAGSRGAPTGAPPIGSMRRRVHTRRPTTTTRRTCRGCAPTSAGRALHSSRRDGTRA
eukprot:scaffold33237_cov33-Tisochrysis_lutea.AAC.3